MTLAERYADKPLSFLINIIENRNDYSEEAFETALAEIKRQGFDRSEIITEVRKRLSDEIENYLTNFNVVNDKLILPTSYYLNEEEVKLLFRQVFATWQNKTDDMTPDSWQYVLGAGLG